MGVCATVLKQQCRDYGIIRWPFRKVRKLDRLLVALVEQPVAGMTEEAAAAVAAAAAAAAGASKSRAIAKAQEPTSTTNSGGSGSGGVGTTVHGDSSVHAPQSANPPSNAPPFHAHLFSTPPTAVPPPLPPPFAVSPSLVYPTVPLAPPAFPPPPAFPLAPPFPTPPRLPLCSSTGCLLQPPQPTAPNSLLQLPYPTAPNSLLHPPHPAVSSPFHSRSSCSPVIMQDSSFPESTRKQFHSQSSCTPVIGQSSSLPPPLRSQSSTLLSTSFPKSPTGRLSKSSSLKSQSDAHCESLTLQALGSHEACPTWPGQVIAQVKSQVESQVGSDSGASGVTNPARMEQQQQQQQEHECYPGGLIPAATAQLQVLAAATTPPLPSCDTSAPSLSELDLLSRLHAAEPGPSQARTEAGTEAHAQARKQVQGCGNQEKQKEAVFGCEEITLTLSLAVRHGMPGSGSGSGSESGNVGGDASNGGASNGDAVNGDSLNGQGGPDIRGVPDGAALNGEGTRCSEDAARLPFANKSDGIGLTSGEQRSLKIGLALDDEIGLQANMPNNSQQQHCWSSFSGFFPSPAVPLYRLQHISKG
ncbi:unnamed protein product [Closterium sp. NIES-54]